MIAVRPSRVGLLPCLFLLLLWIILPPPQLAISPDLDPETKHAALRALELTARSHRRIYKSRILSSSHSRAARPPQQARRISMEVDRGQGLGFAHALPVPQQTHAGGPSVLLVSGIQPGPCSSQSGDYIHLLSTKNKQDYARHHGYDFYLSTKLTSPLLKGAWNKVALIHELLETTEYEWFVWMDYDALVMDMEFALPLDRYHDKDLVLWGQEQALFEQGDAHMGLNTGVFLIHRSEWSKRFLTEVAQYGTGNGKDREADMQAVLGNYDWALFDQNGFTYVLKTWADTARQHVHLETGYYLNGYWKDLPVQSLDDVRPFVKHFMGCQFCSGINQQAQDACLVDFRESWNWADQHVKP